MIGRDLRYLFVFLCCLIGLYGFTACSDAPVTPAKDAAPKGTVVGTVVELAMDANEEPSAPTSAVDFTLGETSRHLPDVVCMNLGMFKTLIASNDEESDLLRIRLPNNDSAMGAKMQKSLQYIDDAKSADTRMVWNAVEMQVREQGAVYEVAGTAKGTGQRLGADGNFGADRALDAGSELPFRLILRCPKSLAG